MEQDQAFSSASPFAVGWIQHRAPSSTLPYNFCCFKVQTLVIDLTMILYQPIGNTWLDWSHRMCTVFFHINWHLYVCFWEMNNEAVQYNHHPSAQIHIFWDTNPYNRTLTVWSVSTIETISLSKFTLVKHFYFFKLGLTHYSILKSRTALKRNFYYNDIRAPNWESSHHQLPHC